MKSIILAASLALPLAAPAFADDVADHGSHHPAATTAPAQPAAVTTPVSGETKPNGMMTCPMMKDGNTSNGMPMQNGMMSGGTMDKSQMAQCPMMQAPSGTATNPPPASTNSDAHNEHR